MGPLLFCLTIHPLLVTLQSDIVFGYLDDVTLGGEAQVVADDVASIIDRGGALGLLLNPSKCEVIVTSPPPALPAPLDTFVKAIDAGDSILLGAPIRRGPSLDKAWVYRCADLSRASSLLQDINAQEGLTLLRAAFGAPKVLQLLRCSPSVDITGPASFFDSLLRSALSGVTNCAFKDVSWIQASLPIKLGGLSLRRAESLALPAYLSSSTSTASLQDAILGAHAGLLDPHLDAYRTRWSNSFGPIPQAEAASKQASWNLPMVEAEKDLVWASCTSAREKASFLAACAPHSGDWLKALPIAACGMRLDDKAFRLGVALRLGLQVCEPHECPCGSLVDACGSHDFVCKRPQAGLHGTAPSTT